MTPGERLPSLEVRSVRHAGGKRYWICKRGSHDAVAHMANAENGAKYANLFAHAPELRQALEWILETYAGFDDDTRDRLENLIKRSRGAL